VNSTPHSSVAATAHFVEAERLVEALPLMSKRGEGTTRRGSPRSTRYSPSPRVCSISDRDPLAGFDDAGRTVDVLVALTHATLGIAVSLADGGTYPQTVGKRTQTPCAETGRAPMHLPIG
jgi:hypothetical protein